MVTRLNYDIMKVLFRLDLCHFGIIILKKVRKCPFDIILHSTIAFMALHRPKMIENRKQMMENAFTLNLAKFKSQQVP